MRRAQRARAACRLTPLRVPSVVVLCLEVVLGAACAPSASDAPPPLQGPSADQKTFWATLQTHCGKAYPGTVDDVTEYYRAGFEGRALIAHFRECSPERIHIALHENDDRSRNRLLTRADGTLRLKHDHRHKDGIGDATSQYGGDAPLPGLANRRQYISRMKCLFQVT